VEDTVTNDTTTADTVAIFRGSRLRTPEEWITWALTRWGWYCGHETWFQTLRALVRSLRGLEAAGVLIYRRAFDDASHPRRSIELTGPGRALARWLVDKDNEEAGHESRDLRPCEPCATSRPHASWRGVCRCRRFATS
jgi:hypothetical protein